MRYYGAAYEPHQLKQICDRTAHGAQRMAALRSAAEAADAHEDTPFRIYFRIMLCEESGFYGDCLDMLVVFPEILAIIDRYPDTPNTCYLRNYKNSMGHVLWVYKWVVDACSEFYQIPMTDCLRYFADFRDRSLAYGYNLRPYYMYRYRFYHAMGREEEAAEAFHAFERLPRDQNSDCRACERNEMIRFYLDQGDMEKVKALSAQIENFSLQCAHDKKAAWLRMKIRCMNHFLAPATQNFTEAQRYCRILEQHMLEAQEYQAWDSFLYCYAHTDMGKALQIYKTHWKEWEEQRNPAYLFGESKNIACFFKELYHIREEKTVRLDMDDAFPLYREDGMYPIADLFRHYAQRAEDMAQRFDARNGTAHYHLLLREAVGEPPWKE